VANLLPAAGAFDARAVEASISLRSGRASKEGRLTPALSQAEPTIHVTIGRVEVRAEIPNGPARRAERASSPVMGLQEYLQCRGKRGIE